MKTLILDNYDSFTYNLYQYCAELGGNPIVFRNNELSLNDIEHSNYTHIIISPGPGSPDNKKDFGICGDVIKKFGDKIPILGVCLGHQGIIHFLGGRVIRAPIPVHGKRSLVKINNKNPLFKNLPEEIEAMRYHSLIGDGSKIPAELSVIAKTKNDKLVMAVAHKSHPLFGVQFHPESIGTPYGKQILKNFLGIKMPAVGMAEKTLCKMADGKIGEGEMGKILLEMAQRGETASEIIGFASGMRKYAKKLPVKTNDLMDTCGTGGSGLPRMNISTAVAFVLASCGVGIAKHGNRAASGRCGSFDLLEELGININMPPSAVVRAIEKVGIGFVFAPAFHPAMKLIAPVRKKLGIKTIFNLLGPLTNPVKPKYHLLGTTSIEIAGKMIEAMQGLGYKRAMVVSGEDGLDDVTLCGGTHIFELNHGKIREFDFLPEQIGIKRVKNFKYISGGSKEKNARIFLNLLEGNAPKDLQNLLYLNAGFGFVARGFARAPLEGFKMAKNAVKSGKAYEKFIEYRDFSRRFLPFMRAINGERNQSGDFFPRGAGKKIAVIAEIKLRSPSFGKFPIKSIKKLVRIYEKNGAAAISVVTEPKLFNGSLELLQKVRGYTQLPILRKDFIKKAEQIDESAKLGANAILLIAKILTKKQLQNFSQRALNKNIVPVIEIHDEKDMKKLRGLNEIIIGINNRNLKTFKTNVNHAKDLLKKIQTTAELRNAPIIIESGFSMPEELKQYKGTASAALIGTALLTSKNPSKTLTQFIHASSSK